MENKELAVAREADEIVSPSLALKDYVLTNWQLSREIVSHLPNPFAPSDALLKIPPLSKSSTVSFFGRLEVRKGIMTLCDAIPEIAKAFPSVQFLFVGRSTELAEGGTEVSRKLSDVCKEVGVKAEFSGQQPKERLPEYLARTMVAVFPSVWENFPYTCLEAMSASRGIVASSEGGMADMIESGVNGLLAPPRDPRKLAKGIVRLLKDADLYQKFGERARDFVLNNYSGAALGRRYEESYERAIEHRRMMGARLQPWLVA